MPRLTVRTENDPDIEIYYEDPGDGQPMVLIHGYRSTVAPGSVNSASCSRPATAPFKGFIDRFHNAAKLGGTRVSEQAWQASFTVAAASPSATHACVDTCLTDFRADLPKNDVPTLVLHGTEDRILPYSVTAARLPSLVPELKLVAVEDGPHNIGGTHPEAVNKALLDFPAE